MRVRHFKLEGGGELIQVYTGNGKGKTTAAIGLAIRCAGAGFKVYLGQFIKGKEYSELKSLGVFDKITVEQFGRGCFIAGEPRLKDVIMAKAGLNKIESAIKSGKYRLVILDEVNVALKLKLLNIGEVVKVLKAAKAATEVVLTGRSLHPQILKLADLVSDIRELKHYYRRGVKARRGIEF